MSDTFIEAWNSTYLLLIKVAIIIMSEQRKQASHVAVRTTPGINLDLNLKLNPRTALELNRILTSYPPAFPS